MHRSELDSRQHPRQSGWRQLHRLDEAAGKQEEPGPRPAATCPEAGLAASPTGEAIEQEVQFQYYQAVAAERGAIDSEIRAKLGRWREIEVGAQKVQKETPRRRGSGRLQAEEKEENI